jgi:hypothetical protein
MNGKNLLIKIVVLASIIGLASCPEGNDSNEKTYTVTIGALINGSITANPTSGVAGTEITFTVNPKNLYRLKAGTLKYGTTAIDETTLKFNLPAKNVTVTAVFESKFVGSWKIESIGNILTFSENIYTEQSPNGNYLTKGTWVTENPNRLILTSTHWGAGAGNITNINDLPIHVNPTSNEFTFEFLSNLSVKLLTGSSDYILTLQ